MYLNATVNYQICRNTYGFIDDGLLNFVNKTPQKNQISPQFLCGPAYSTLIRGSIPLEQPEKSLLTEGQDDVVQIYGLSVQWTLGHTTPETP